MDATDLTELNRSIQQLTEAMRHMHRRAEVQAAALDEQLHKLHDERLILDRRLEELEKSRGALAWVRGMLGRLARLSNADDRPSLQPDGWLDPDAWDVLADALEVDGDPRCADS